MTLPRRLPLTLAIAALALPVAAGCGSSGGSGYGDRGSTGQEPGATATTPAAPPGAAAQSCQSDTGTEQLRVTGADCDAGRAVAVAWVEKAACSGPADASRYSCALDGYRCLGAAVDDGIAVSCSRPGSSVAFVAKRD